MVRREDKRGARFGGPSWELGAELVMSRQGTGGKRTVLSSSQESDAAARGMVGREEGAGGAGGRLHEAAGRQGVGPRPIAMDAGPPRQRAQPARQRDQR